MSTVNDRDFQRPAAWVWILAMAVFCPLGCGPDQSIRDRKPAVESPFAFGGLTPPTNMVLIRAGAFFRVKHQVVVSRDFWLGKYEVTQEEYTRLMGKNPSKFTDQSNAPVEKVSHVEAVEYCQVLTRRERQAGRLPTNCVYCLPTEAQWEYACRAGSTNLFSFGDSADTAGQHAWTWENSEGTTHPVGRKQPNAWGLYDMHGNVWEWCQDWFSPYPAKEVTDPVGPTSGKHKVFRGGGWNNEVKMARSGNRFMMAPTNGIHFVGFRVALVQEVESDGKPKNDGPSPAGRQ
jgi:formylglycine-generating enzyme required for sulfatase activity